MSAAELLELRNEHRILQDEYAAAKANEGICGSGGSTSSQSSSNNKNKANSKLAAHRGYSISDLFAAKSLEDATGTFVHLAQSGTEWVMDSVEAVRNSGGDSFSGEGSGAGQKTPLTTEERHQRLFMETFLLTFIIFAILFVCSKIWNIFSEIRRQRRWEVAAKTLENDPVIQEGLRVPLAGLRRINRRNKRLAALKGTIAVGCFVAAPMLMLLAEWYLWEDQQQAVGEGNDDTANNNDQQQLLPQFGQVSSWITTLKEYGGNGSGGGSSGNDQPLDWRYVAIANLLRWAKRLLDGLLGHQGANRFVVEYGFFTIVGTFVTIGVKVMDSAIRDVSGGSSTSSRSTRKSSGKKNMMMITGGGVGEDDDKDASRFIEDMTKEAVQFRVLHPECTVDGLQGQMTTLFVEGPSGGGSRNTPLVEGQDSNTKKRLASQRNNDEDESPKKLQLPSSSGDAVVSQQRVRF